MGFTLRAALDALPAAARVRVAELHPCVVSWCRGVLAPLTGGAALDPRVAIELGDVGERIRRAAAAGDGARFDAILLDLYTGPGAGAGRQRGLLRGRHALGDARRARAGRRLRGLVGAARSRPSSGVCARRASTRSAAVLEGEACATRSTPRRRLA